MFGLVTKIFLTVCICVALFYLSTVVTIWPENYFWVSRKNAVMPVWIKGNIESGVFIIYNHGGPGSSGTLESIIEVTPGSGKIGHASPIVILEEEYALVYWDQRHSGLSKGNVDANESVPEDFGADLAIVIDELNKRYQVRKLFLIGASWGHTVAVSYMTTGNDFKRNQSNINGYIGYKGNHEWNLPYRISRMRVLEYAENEIRKKRNVEYWQTAQEFYANRESARNIAEIRTHQGYIQEVMGSSISYFDRAYYSVKASIFSPFNGWRHASNNIKTNKAKKFLNLVATTSIGEHIHRIAVPTLLIYGKQDLIAPVEVGEYIYHNIATKKQDKTLLILNNSRHGVEEPDVRQFQQAIVDFIERYK
jgi:pimeloyl-ACP methyl ester carboxylesterase